MSFFLNKSVIQQLTDKCVWTTEYKTLPYDLIQ